MNEEDINKRLGAAATLGAGLFILFVVIVGALLFSPIRFGG